MELISLNGVSEEAEAGIYRRAFSIGPEDVYGQPSNLTMEKYDRAYAKEAMRYLRRRWKRQG